MKNFYNRIELLSAIIILLMRKKYYIDSVL